MSIYVIFFGGWVKSQCQDSPWHRRQVEPAICADDDCGVYEVQHDAATVLKTRRKKAIDGYQSEKLGFALQRLLIKDFGAVIAVANCLSMFA